MQIQPAREPVCCETRRQLAEQFAITARLYNESVVVLTRSAGRMSPQEWDSLRKGAEQAQQRAEAAGLAFEEHVDWHRCSGPDGHR